MEGQNWLKKRDMLSIDAEYSDEMTLDSKIKQTPGLR